MRLKTGIRRGILWAAIGFVAVLAGLPGSLRAAESSPDARTLVHLLDYIAADYGGAVQDGKVVSDLEFAEMQEFTSTTLQLKPLFFETGIETEIQNQLTRLKQLVEGKGDAVDVAKLARETKSRIIQAARLPMAPRQWPDLARGKELYSQLCVSCHGDTGHGDGLAGANLDPKPSNFHDAERMGSLSPFQAYNTITLGVQGTGMASFAVLPDKDIWALAFYVKSLLHGAQPGTTPLPSGIGLEQVASFSDEQLEQLLPGDADGKTALLAAIRSIPGDSDTRGGATTSTLPVALTKLDEALSAYQAGDTKSARSLALTAYLEGVEPVEPRLRALSPETVVNLETRMAEVRMSIDQDRPGDQVAAAVASARTAVMEAGKALDERKTSPLLTFSMAVAIVLREAFEAILVIIAILGVMRAIGAQKQTIWVHAGWVLALLLGVVTWMVSGRLINISGMQRELMEAIAALAAVVILLYLGFWLHSKTEIGRWKAFIEDRVKSALAGGNLFTLAAISFLAVFREAFETVLFLSALGLEGGESAKTAMGAGVAVSAVLVAVMSWMLVRFSARIPIRTLFSASSAVMGLLAIVLTGKGLHSLQETGLMSMTAMPFSFRLDLIGIYPTFETLSFQFVILGVAAALWYYARKPSTAVSPVRIVGIGMLALFLLHGLV